MKANITALLSQSEALKSMTHTYLTFLYHIYETTQTNQVDVVKIL